MALKRQLPSWQRRSASTALESGQSQLGCAHRHGGQRWRTRELSGEKEATSALRPAGTWWGRVRGTQDRHSLLMSHFRKNASGLGRMSQTLSLINWSKDCPPLCLKPWHSVHFFSSNHPPPNHSGNPGGLVLSSLHPNSDRTECL